MVMVLTITTAMARTMAMASTRAVCGTMAMAMVMDPSSLYPSSLCTILSYIILCYITP